MLVKWKKLHPLAQIPKLQTSGAACVDLVATEIQDYNNGRVQVKFGFACKIPEGYKIVIVPRSSFTLKGWVLANSPAQIDSDYTDEWMLRFEAIPSYGSIYNRVETNIHEEVTGVESELTLQCEHFPYRVGDRVAQCYLEKVIPIEFEEVEELPATDRKGGFGSTGIN